MPRVLLLVPATSYRAGAFLDAARRLQLDVTVGSNHRQVLAELTPGRSLYIEFHDTSAALQQILSHCRDYPIVAVVGTDDDTTGLAARAGQALGLPHNDTAAVQHTCDKFEFRQIIARAELNCPRFERIALSVDPASVAAKIPYPCVLKPLNLSGSRGVIRANNEEEFIRAFHRTRRIVQSSTENGRDESLLVEDFIAGVEVSLEGIVEDGRLRTLALFDKPDPLNGPFFEESIYVTPSRLTAPEQDEILTQARAAVAAVGLATGPIHAELRLGVDGAYVIEIAARTIGGLCSRVLKFQDNITLEEMVLRQAIGSSARATATETPSGVMMIPIPHAGVLRRVSGLAQAGVVSGITGIEITVPVGDTLVPLPEGDRYLGFVFAEARSPVAVEEALRTAHARLEFDIRS